MLGVRGVVGGALGVEGAARVRFLVLAGAESSQRDNHNVGLSYTTK